LVVEHGRNARSLGECKVDPATIPSLAAEAANNGPPALIRARSQNWTLPASTTPPFKAGATARHD